MNFLCLFVMFSVMSGTPLCVLLWPASGYGCATCCRGKGPGLHPGRTEEASGRGPAPVCKTARTARSTGQHPPEEGTLTYHSQGGADLGVYNQRSTHCQTRWEDLRCWAQKISEAQLGKSFQRGSGARWALTPLMQQILVVAYPDLDGRLKAAQQSQGETSLQVITVSQPRTTNVTAGDTATLQCSFNSSETTTIGGYKWFFINPSSTSVTEVTNMSEKFSGRVFIPKHTIFTSQRKANIDIHNMQHNDVGRYVCEVELFMINLKGRGNGTQLLVLEAPRIQGPGFPSSWMALYIGLGLACLLLPTIVLIVCMRKRRRESCPDSSNAVVYAKVPRQGKKGKHGQTTNSLQDEFQDRLHYATLSIEEGNRRSRPCKASDQVVYSGVQTDDHPGVSKRPFQDPDHILYTRVNSVTGANEAHRSREKQESVVYARTPLSG